MNSKYPARIGRAIGLLSENKIRSATTLSRAANAALRAIITFIDAKAPELAIYPRRQTLADRVKYSARSIERGLSELAAGPWIIKIKQQRRKSGETWQWSTAPIQLTPYAIAELGLEARAGKALSTVDTSANMADNLNTSPLTTQDSHAARGSFEKVGDISLPSDLVFLTEKGIQPRIVLSLMKLARAKNKLLSNIVNAKREILERLNARRGYGLIRFLINAEYDAEAELQNKRSLVEATEAHVLAQKAKLDTAAEIEQLVNQLPVRKLQRTPNDGMEIVPGPGGAGYLIQFTQKGLTSCRPLTLADLGAFRIALCSQEVCNSQASVHTRPTARENIAMVKQALRTRLTKGYSPIVEPSTPASAG